MKTVILQILKKWEKVVAHEGSLKVEHYSAVAEEIDNYIRTDENKTVTKLLASCRDSAITASTESHRILKNIRVAYYLIRKNVNDEKRDNGEQVDLGQRQRYKYATRKLYLEKLRFMKDKNLREADLSLLEGKENRKVRRIIEKRMCQEYHKQHKLFDSYRLNAKKRHDMDRAVSYQVYNLGQYGAFDFKRSSSSHWKRVEDYASKDYVLKKKMEYETMAEAKIHIELYKLAHPEDKRPMSAYYCPHCQHYHIGHNTKYDTAS